MGDEQVQVKKPPPKTNGHKNEWWDLLIHLGHQKTKNTESEKWKKYSHFTREWTNERTDNYDNLRNQHDADKRDPYTILPPSPG